MTQEKFLIDEKRSFIIDHEHVAIKLLLFTIVVISYYKCLRFLSNVKIDNTKVEVNVQHSYKTIIPKVT